MTRTATGATLTLLDALEPEAKAAWEADLINIQEAIAASQAITNRRQADAAETQMIVSVDTNKITVTALPAETRETLPPSLRSIYDETYVEP